MTYYDINSELDAVKAIFPEMIEHGSTFERIVVVCLGGRVRVIIRRVLSSEKLILFEINAPDFFAKFKKKLLEKLDDVCASHLNEPILYNIVDAIINFCNNAAKNDIEGLNNSLSSINLCSNESALPYLDYNKKKGKQNELTIDKTPSIFSGRVFEDRKSVFQGHFAIIESKEEAELVLSRLKENSKIARATHNIYAYRVNIKSKTDNKTVELKDCDDDGETGAGSKLLRLLHLMKMINIVVIVTRWYGGIHLGPDRFRHITNLAREVILDGKQALGKIANK